MTDTREIAKNLFTEVGVKPHSVAEAMAKKYKLNNLFKTLRDNDDVQSKAILALYDKYDAEKKQIHKRSKLNPKNLSAFDPKSGVEFTDQLGNKLTFEVNNDWVDQTKLGTTTIQYAVYDLDQKPHHFDCKVTVEKYHIESTGITDTSIPYVASYDEGNADVMVESMEEDILDYLDDESVELKNIQIKVFNNEDKY